MKRQAVIDDGLPYIGGEINQRCEVCGWKPHRRNRNEYATCPGCGSTLDPPTEIRFGGITIHNRHDSSFIITDNGGDWGDSTLIDRADAYDALTFMARRYKPFATGPSLPTLARIRVLVDKALAAAQARHLDIAEQTLLDLQWELDPSFTSSTTHDA